MRQAIRRVWSHTSLKLVGEFVLIAGSVGLAAISITELVKSFTVYQGYEVGLVRVAAVGALLVGAAMAFLSVKLFRSSGGR